MRRMIFKWVLHLLESMAVPMKPFPVSMPGCHTLNNGSMKLCVPCPTILLQTFAVSHRETIPLIGQENFSRSILIFGWMPYPPKQGGILCQQTKMESMLLMPVALYSRTETHLHYRRSRKQSPFPTTDNTILWSWTELETVCAATAHCVSTKRINLLCCYQLSSWDLVSPPRFFRLSWVFHQLQDRLIPRCHPQQTFLHQPQQ
mmetsp:Transcript_25322/g.43109  ORF Transcript_25322/g.43109 Transcript_25322/m.43109 type:complete len:203 (-) Transcript_25322:663-1271(-)